MSQTKPAAMTATNLIMHAEKGRIVVLDVVTLQDNFNVLGSRKSSLAQRRAAAHEVAQSYVALRVGMDADLFSPNGYKAIAQGSLNAANASPYNSKDEGLNALLWESAKTKLSANDPKAGVDELRRAALDTNIKRRGTVAKTLANNLNFHGMIWQPELWGNTAVSSTFAFNRTARHIKQLLQPNSRHMEVIKEGQSHVLVWRVRQHEPNKRLPGLVQA